jgi:nucleotide-binding universal stress UspA family protein
MAKTFQTILVPVDFSPYATEALLYATSIADRFSAALLVLHVVSQEAKTYATHRHLEHRGMPHHVFPLLGPYTEPVEEPQEVTDAVAVDFRERGHVALQEFLPPELVGHRLELRVAVGYPFEQIIETARHDNADLIVMGTHGRSGLKHVVLGSVAERVVRLAACPVMTVKAMEGTPS